MNRIFWFVPTLLAMAAVTFFIMHATPGSPFDVSDKQRPEDIARLEALYGLDKPLPEQFGLYVWNAVHLDFGISYHARPQTVNEIIGRTFPISLHLGAMATLFAIVVGMTLGVLAAVNQNGVVDYFSVTLAVLFYSMPCFVMGFLLILLYVVWLPDIGNDRGFRVAVESNGTLPAVEGIDWLCISPKAGTDVVQRSGDELKLVWPQEGIDPAALEQWDFQNFLIQPMDCERREEALDSAIRLVMERPCWRLSLQTHKLIGLP